MNLAEARAGIGRIDAGLLRLLNRRAAIVKRLHASKTRHRRPIYDAARTAAILDRLVRLNKGPLRDEHVLALFTFLLHHFAFEHRPGRRPPEPPLLLAEAAPGSDRRRVAAILRRHGIGAFRGRRKGIVDARRDREAVLRAVAAGKGALLRVSDDEDEEALALLCYRARLLALAGGPR